MVAAGYRTCSVAAPHEKLMPLETIATVCPGFRAPDFMASPSESKMSAVPTWPQCGIV
ncbi:hypothetical protein D3C72_2585610 [compost metagenome]